MAAFKWEKIASVTPGGKPYFYLARDGNGTKLSVAWNRMHKEWQLDRNDKWVAYFETDRAAKMFAAKNYELQPWR